jgi:PAS domain S-box
MEPSLQSLRLATVADEHIITALQNSIDTSGHPIEIIPFPVNLREYGIKSGGHSANTTEDSPSDDTKATVDIDTDASSSSTETSFQVSSSDLNSDTLDSDAITYNDSTTTVDCLLIERGSLCTADYDAVIQLQRERYPDLPIVALADDSSTETMTTALDAGATTFFPRELCLNRPELVITRILNITTDTSTHIAPHTAPESSSAVEMTDTSVTSSSQTTQDSVFEDSHSISASHARSTEISAIGFQHLCTPAAIIDVTTGTIATLNHAFAELLTHNDDRQDTAGSENNSIDISQCSGRALQSVWDTSATDDFNSLAETLTTVAESKTQQTGDLALTPISEDNTTRWISATLCPIQPSDQFIILTGEEITDIRQQYPESGHVVEIFDQPTTTHDPETGAVRKVNDAFVDILGYHSETNDNESLISKLAVSSSTTETDVNGNTNLDNISGDNYTHTKTQESHSDIQSAIIQAGNEWNPSYHEWQVETANGTTRWLSTNIWPGKDNDGRCVYTVSRDITARKRQEMELDTIKRRFQLVTENVDEIIYVVDADFSEIKYVSDAYEEIWGRSIESLYDDTTAFIDGIDPRDRETFREDFEEMRQEIRAGNPADNYEFEFRIRRPDGDIRWILATGYPVVTDVGPDRYVGFAEDITERRQLKNSYQTLFESISDGLVLHEPQKGDILQVNQQFCSMYGYDREELEDKPFDTVLPDDPEFGYDQALNRIKEVDIGESNLFEWRGQRSNGEIFPVEVHLRAIEIRGCRRILASVRDITDRKERKEQIRESEQTYREIFDKVSAGISIHDPETKDIVEVNDTICSTLGYDRETLLNTAEWITSDDDSYSIKRGAEIIDQVMDSGTSRKYEWVVEDADGNERVMLIKGSPATIDGETRYLATSQEITGRKRRETLVKNLQCAIDDIQDAESKAAIHEIVVKTVRDALNLPLTTCWIHPTSERDSIVDNTVGDDLPIAEDILLYASGDAPKYTVGIESEDNRHFTAKETIKSNSDTACEIADISGLQILHTESDEYSIFSEGETTAYSPPNHRSGNPLTAAIAIPIGSHGLLIAGDHERDTYESYLIDAAQVLAGHAATALDRVERAAQVHEHERRLQAIIDRIDEAIFLSTPRNLLTDDSERAIISSGYADIWGRTLSELHEVHEEGFFETLHPDDRTSHRRWEEQIVDEMEAGDYADRYSREYRIIRPDGSVRWIHSDYYPTEWDDDRLRLVVVGRDITAQRQRQKRIESFHDATAELTTADTVDDAGEIAVEAAASVLDLPATAVYHYNDDTGTLDPIATGPATSVPAADSLQSLTAAESPVWKTFVDETVQRVDLETTPCLDIGTFETAAVLPLGRNGVLVVWQSADIDLDIASILAATLEAALNRLRGEQRLESQRAALDKQTERARRLESITKLTQRVEAAITTQSSRTGTYEAVCSELVDVDPFSGAWVSTAPVGTDQLSVQTAAGIETDTVERYLHVEEELSDSESDNSTQNNIMTENHPTIEAWQTNSDVAVSGLVETGRQQSWRRVLLRQGIGAVCAVPISYEGITYGVLTIVATGADAFDDRTVNILSQLGTSAGYAITALERQRALESDETIELEFRGHEMNLPFARVATQTDGRVRHDRTVRRQNGSVSVYYTIFDDTPSTLVETAENTFTGNIETVTKRDNAVVIERQGSSWFGSLVSECGGILRQCRAEGAETTLIIELPQETNTRTIVERILEAFPGLELTAQRQHHETGSTPEEIRSQLEQRLTDRQLEAIETAHTMGYFDWPRESSGEEVAATLGITQPTVNKHIRLGEHGIFELLFKNQS